MGKENRINPYDLSSVAGDLKKRREQEEQARQARIAARIARLESFGESINPYDLSQLAEIFELDRPHHWR